MYVVNVGDRFGRLVVNALVYEKHVYKAKCVCDCGNTIVSTNRNLYSGAAQSCGCRRREMLHRMGIGVSPPSPCRHGKHTEMHTCNNCGEKFDPDADGLVTKAKAVVVAAICGNCCKDVRVAKLVLKKPDLGPFQYEQWSPMEMATSGLSSNKRAG